MNKQAGGVAAVVLAAGTSQRMGSTVPKQLLQFGNKTLLEHALENVRAAQVSEIVLVLGAQSDEIRGKVADHGITTVFNPDYQQGMGTSLRTGLAALGPSATAALIVLADQPFVASATVDRLIHSHAESRAQITIPLYRGFRGNPVLLDRSVFPELMALSGDVGCRAIFGSHTEGIHKVEVDDPGILVDIDTAADLQRFEQFTGANAVRRLPELEQRSQDLIQGPELVIVGHDEVCRALGALARILKFSVAFVDPLLTLNEFPEADRVLHMLDFSRLPTGEKFVVVASRGQCDEEALEQAMIGNASYVGLLANRNRAQELLNALRVRGIPNEKLQTVHSPAGLSLGASSAEEIALSILAEVVASKSKR
ncbi:MAG TPA: NTP transferase domain-containing protein [Candidatus Angelobacter sp.]|nr:NTP transferase domain-containing protein [Candidatus Angelobacter sp.]